MVVEPVGRSHGFWRPGRYLLIQPIEWHLTSFVTERANSPPDADWNARHILRAADGSGSAGFHVKIVGLLQSLDLMRADVKVTKT